MFLVYFFYLFLLCFKRLVYIQAKYLRRFSLSSFHSTGRSLVCCLFIELYLSLLLFFVMVGQLGLRTSNRHKISGCYIRLSCMNLFHVW